MALTKIQSAGLSTPVDLIDNAKIRFGTGNDLEIFHDGANSNFYNTTGEFKIRGNDLRLMNAAGNEHMLIGSANGAVNLYWDNSKKLETTSVGATVTGSLGIGISTPNVGLHQHVGTSGTNSHQFTNTTTGSSSTDGFILGLSGDEHVLLWNYENTPFRLATNSQERMRISGDGPHLLLGGTSDVNEITETSANAGIVIGTTSMGNGGLAIINSTTGTGRIYFGDGVTNSAGRNRGQINYYHNGDYMLFAAAGSERLRLTSTGASVTGDLSISSATPILNFTETNANPDYRLLTDGGEFVIQNDNSGSFATKFKVTTSGVTVTGNVFPSANDSHALGGSSARWQELNISDVIDVSDNGKIRMGDGDDLQIYHDGSHSYIDNNTGSLRVRDAGGAEKFRVSGTGTQFNDDITLSNDNDKINIGAGNDLQIYHDGSNSFIKDAGTGTLILNSNQVNINNAANNEHLARFSQDGAVELYYDGSKKFETNQFGAVVLDPTDETVQLRLENNTGITGYLFSLNSNTISLLDSQAHKHVQGIKDGSTELYYDNSKKLETTSDGISVTGKVMPSANNTHNIGSADLRFVNLFLSNALDMADSAVAQFGNSDDLKIYHDGSNSYIDNITGDLKIQDTTAIILSTNSLRLRAANAEAYIAADANSDVSLFYDNVKRFETTSTGVKTLGDVSFRTSANSQTILYDESDGQLEFVDSVKATFGTGNDLQIYHNGSNARIINNSGDFYIGGIFIGLMNAALNEWKIQAYDNGAVNLFYDNSKKLETISSGVQVTGDLLATSNVKVYDNKSLLAGSGNDLQIYHDGTYNVFNCANGNNFDIKYGSEYVARFGPNGNNELFYDNSKKLETTSTGAKVNGKFESSAAYNVVGAEIKGGATGYSEPLIVKTANNTTRFTVDGDGKAKVPDDGKFVAGASDDLQLYHNGLNSYVVNSTGWLVLGNGGSGTVIKGATDENAIACTANGAVELYYDNSKKLETFANGIKLYDTQGDLIGEGFDGGFNFTSLVYVDELRLGDSEKIQLGASQDLQIYHDGSNSYVIDSGTGNLYIGTNDFNVTNAAVTESFIKAVENGGVELYYDNSKKFETTSTGATITGNLVNTGLCVAGAGFAQEDHAAQLISTAAVGSATTTYYIGNAAITTSSDQRLKENIVNTELNAITELNKVRVVDFTWNDPSDKAVNNRNARGKWTGCLAQEMVNIFPHAVNAPRPEGKEIDHDSEHMWGMEYQHLVPVLIKAVQELSAKVAALEAA